MEYTKRIAAHKVTSPSTEKGMNALEAGTKVEKRMKQPLYLRLIALRSIMYDNGLKISLIEVKNEPFLAKPEHGASLLIQGTPDNERVSHNSSSRPPDPV